MPASTTGDLLFGRPAPTTGDLVFGGDSAAPATVTLSVQAALPALGAAVVLAPEVEVSVQAALPALGAAAVLSSGVAVSISAPGAFGAISVASEVSYASQTSRPLVGTQRHGWQQAAQSAAGGTIGAQSAAPAPAGWAAHWRQSVPAPHGVEHLLLGTLEPMHEQQRSSHSRATATRTAVSFAHQDAAPAFHSRPDRWQNATALRRATGFRHQDADRSKRAQRATGWQAATRRNQSRSTSFQPTTAAPHTGRGRYQRAVPPPAGISIWGTPPPPVRPPCYVPSGHLLFSIDRVAGSAHLLFVCERPRPPGAAIVIPVRRVYIVHNLVTMRRVDGDIDLPVYGGSMAVDAGSWTWSWSATLYASALPHVRRLPGDPPVEVEALINGVPYRLRVLKVARDRQFASERIRVSGQGLASVLAAPYAAAQTFNSPALATARQIADSVLTVSGVPFGWTVDWGITDWSVPGGSWALQGTFIEAINDIAAAAGAYVQPHPTGQVLRILPLYPRAPWAWGELTPDVELPAAAVQVEGTEWVDRPGYNRVFVGGVGAGVFGPVTITASGGGSVAPLVTHALITAPEAHRQRGLAELAAAVSRVERQIKLQVLPATGILMPGSILDYVDGSVTSRGIVRSAQVDWSGPVLRQTLGLECHEVT